MWSSINTNAGADIIGAGVTYFFTRGSREDELVRDKADCIFRQQYPNDTVSHCKASEQVTREAPKPNKGEI